MKWEDNYVSNLLSACTHLFVGMCICTMCTVQFNAQIITPIQNTHLQITVAVFAIDLYQTKIKCKRANVANVEYTA